MANAYNMPEYRLLDWTQMPPDQLQPLEINPATQEVFLRLRKHKNIVLTPVRWHDAPHMVPLFNDVRVYEWISSPPYPYFLSQFSHPGILKCLTKRIIVRGRWKVVTGSQTFLRWGFAGSQWCTRRGVADNSQGRTNLFSSRGPRRRDRHIHWDTFHHALLSWRINEYSHRRLWTRRAEYLCE